MSCISDVLNLYIISSPVLVFHQSAAIQLVRKIEMPSHEHNRNSLICITKKRILNSRSGTGLDYTRYLYWMHEGVICEKKRQRL